MSIDFWAGYVSGAASIVVGNPLDLLKVRLQSTHKTIPAARAQRWQSLRALAAGLPAPVMTYGALNALLFTSYNRCLKAFNPGDYQGIGHGGNQKYPLWAHFLAGSAAGFATFFISTPTEYIKCRAQVADTSSFSHPMEMIGKDRSSFSIAMRTLKERGIKGIFLGGTITSLRDAIGYGFWFATYEASKELYDKHWEMHSEDARIPNNEVVKVLLCGGVAGVATWTCVYPLDVIKTRTQTQPLTSIDTLATSASFVDKGSPFQTQKKGAWMITKEAYAIEGHRVFWRGIGVCCLRAFIVNAVQWSAYEQAMDYLS